MRELREIEAMRRVQDARDALRPPSPPSRRRGRPTIIAQAQAQIVWVLAQLPEHSPWLASLAPHHLARVAEARRDLERRARRARSEACTGHTGPTDQNLNNAPLPCGHFHRCSIACAVASHKRQAVIAAPVTCRR
jgi:hypothetical protein